MANENIKVIRTPIHAPNANAHIERWVGRVRRECLDRLLIVGGRQLEHVVRVSFAITTSADRTARSTSRRPTRSAPPRLEETRLDD